MNAVIIVPLRAGAQDREKLWEFARAWWENDHPDWRIIEGHHNAGPFNRSAAINLAAEEAGEWDVAVIIDADVLVDPHQVRSIVDIAAGTDALAIASAERWMLNKAGTEKILSGFKGKWDEFVRQRYGTLEDPRGAQVSCCIAVSRALWERVGGFDELHVGYGWEDVSFRNACESISGKATVWLAPHPIWHLHHEPSPEDREGGALKSANEKRARRYISAHGDRAATRALIDEHLTARIARADLPETIIPRVLHRTVPAETSEQVESWWSEAVSLHPGWETKTYRDPLDPAEWPLTGDLFSRCQNGAQLAGLVRLEALHRDGGIYLDSDVKVFRSLEPLLRCEGFAGWEDSSVVPDAVLGFRKGHPAVELMIAKARASIEGGGDAWQSGPGVTTELLPGRHDVILLAPGSLFPFHYLEKARAREINELPPPYAFVAHQWNGSWLTDRQRKSIITRQRA